MLPLRVLVVSLAGSLAAGSWTLAHAQCPDGTPPPCRAAVTAIAHHAPPPLDERTWIVLPFDNQSRAPDVDWMRDAAVNLLYLNLARWHDVHVIDDERVADYIRDVPEARTATLGLDAGMRVARRAGAGKLIMGDVLKLGATTQVVAKVFDVRSGQRIRTVHEETSNPDSLMAVFARLARGILNVPGPAAAGAAIGTTSLAAYQEYLAGVRALNAWDLGTARTHFDSALVLDTTFALAHYKLSITFGWENGSSPDRIHHAEAAARFAEGLPPRERTLIRGQLAQAHGRWGESCEAYGSLVRADSTDVEAWYNFGECNYHDPVVVPVAGDTTRLTFEGNWNLALKAFERTLELDPSYHLAFAHIPDILQAEQRTGCRPAAGETTCSTQTYIAEVIRQGDTLALTPVSVMAGAAIGAQLRLANSNGTRHANIVLSRDLAAAWVQAGPNEPRAHAALGRALLRLGDLDSAAHELDLVGTPTSRVDRLTLAQDRYELDLKLGHYAEARAIYDTLQAGADSIGGNVAASFAIAGIGLGRFAHADVELAPLVPASARPFIAVITRFLAGVPPDSTQAVALAIVDSAIAHTTMRPAEVIGNYTIWTARSIQGWPRKPPTDTLAGDARVRLAAFVIRNDTTGARRTLAVLDSTVRATPLESSEMGMLLAMAEGYLAIGDSSAAFDHLVEYERRFPYAQVFDRLTSSFTFGSFMWARTFLLEGDVAAALGHTDVAVRAYRRVVGIWESGDPEVQPAVARARAAIARLGSP